MTIAVNTSPTNSISNLGDLVTEIRDEMDDAGLAADKIYRAIGRAEAVFNRELRVPQMETEYEFSVTAEQTDLPSDFLQLRTVYQEGSPDSPLRSMSPAGLRNLFMGISGTPCAYALENRRIMIAPVGNTTLTILYYARVPALTDSNPSNWLIDEYPDIYLHYTLSILFNKTGDSERAALNLGIAQDLIEQANATGRKARWGAGPLRPLLVQQVTGARI